MTVMVTSIKDPFAPEWNEKKVQPYVGGKRLPHYLQHIDLTTEGVSYIVAVNGNVIPPENLHEVEIRNTDIIAVGSKIEAAGAAGAIAGYFATAGTVAYGAIYAVAYVGSLFVFGLGVSLIAGALGPGIPEGDDRNKANTYGWGTLRQTIKEGVRIPYIFGTVKMAGHVLNQYTSVKDNDETLNVLLGLTDHALTSITDIKLNDRAYTSYHDVTVGHRLGTLDETDTIPGHGNVVVQTSVGSLLLKDTPTAITTDGNQVNTVRVFLTANRGLYYTNKKGKLDSRSVIFKIEYRIVGAASWTLSRNETVTGATTDPQRYTYDIENLSANKYEVRVTRLNEPEASYKGSSDITFSLIQEIVKEEFIFPGTSLYYISALATDQLSGGIPSFTCLATRDTVEVYNSNTGYWITKRATSPCWAAYALMNEFGDVPAESKIIWDEWDEWGNYCDEIVDGDYRFVINTVVYDGNFWGEMQRIAKLGRAAIIRRGVRYGIFADMPTDEVTDMFTMGNVIEGTTRIQYLSKKDRANAIEVEYTDLSKDSSRQIITVYSGDYLDGTENPQKVNLPIKAAISQKQAIREGIYRINGNNLLNRVITFDAFVDSFAATCGDVFYFQHAIPDYEKNLGGRIVAAGNNYAGTGKPFVKLDAEFEIKVGKQYAILVRLRNNSIIEKITDNVPGITDVMILTSPWVLLPVISGEEKPVYTFGELNTYKKKYRLTTVTRKADFVRSLTAIEYIPELWTNNDGFIIEEPTEELQRQQALSVSINEFLVWSKDGTQISNLSVVWLSSVTAGGYLWAIWLEDITAGTEPILVATVSKLNYTISSNLVLGDEYKVYIVPGGEGAVIDGANTDTVTIQGKLAPPGDIVAFSGTWNSVKRIVVFLWTTISDIDLDLYEIREGLIWDTGTVVAESIGSSASIFIAEGVTETKKYWIAAKDSSGIYSTVPISTEVVIDTTQSDLDTPTGLTLTTNSSVASDGTIHTFINASWNSNAEVSGDFHNYELWLENIPVGKFSSNSTTRTNFQWEVQPNVLYGVSVRAVDRLGIPTAFSAQDEITSASDSQAPATPTWPPLLGIVPGFKVMGLNWNDNTEADLSHYVFQRATNSSFTSAFTSGSIDASYSADVQLAVSTLYYYRVKAVDTSGNVSGWSVTKSGTTLQIGQSDVAYNSIIANHINVSLLSAISANIGTITAGLLQNAAGTVTIDLTNGTINFGNKLTWNGVTLGVNGEIKNATVNGETLISGGYIRTSLISADMLLVGPKGDTGDTGARGYTGTTGAPGIDGADGINGINGTDGADGTALWAYPNTTLIDGGKVYTDTITANAIKARTITSTQIATKTITAASAVLGDASVDTLQIAGQAVTLPISSFTAAKVQWNKYGWTTAQSASITSSGVFPIFIIFSSIIEGIGIGGDFSFEIQIVRDSTIIYGPIEYGYRVPFIAFSISDTPGPGVHTYNVQGAQNRVESIGSMNSSLLLLQAKR